MSTGINAGERSAVARDLGSTNAGHVESVRASMHGLPIDMLGNTMLAEAKIEAKSGLDEHPFGIGVFPRIKRKRVKYVSKSLIQMDYVSSPPTAGAVY